MKYIIAGGRDFGDRGTMNMVMGKLLNESDIVITGMADGADTLAWDIANEWNYAVREFPITKDDWDTFGKAAGPIRNRKMAEAGDALIAFWDGESRGTKNMIDTAMAMGLELHVYRY